MSPHKAQDLRYAKVVGKAGFLGGQPNEASDRKVPGIAAEERHYARAGATQARKQSDGRGLAGPVRAKNG